MSVITREQTHVTHDGVIRSGELEEPWASMSSWEGRNDPWIPPVPLPIHGGLQLHSEFDEDIDPVTYQVLRYRLWNVNLAHSDAIKKVSGAPFVCYLDDFSTSLHAENGDTVLCGPSMVYFVGLADLGVKWALQNRSDNPGICDGDVFMHNDPYIGVTHQNDVAVFAPIFHDGKLFSWVYSGAHQPDVGGMQQGSWCPNAVDMYQEALPWPAVKLVEGGVLRRDVLELFTRHSRASHMVELQARGQLAGIEAGRRRVQEMIDEYGPRVVKGAMRRMIADTSAAVSKRLLSLPDGEASETWRMSVPGHFGHLARMARVLRKEGDLLTFSNKGTDPQMAAGVNGSYATFRSGAVVAASLLLAWDQLYCPAGVLNHLRFEPEVGTLSIARFPGAVSTQLFTVMGMHQSRVVLARMMLLGDDELRQRATAASVAQGSTIVPMGVFDDGTESYANFWDNLMGSTAGSPSGDGEDIGGAWYQPKGGGANVEEIESTAPMIYLYRREKPDSGGPGRFRGGNSIEVAEIAHKAQWWMVQPVGSDPSIVCNPGFAGGWPAHAGCWLGKHETGLHELLASGRLPGSRRELDDVLGSYERITTRNDFYAESDGVILVDQYASAGYGDPLHREPERVLADVESGSVSIEAASSRYGVVIVDGAIDGTATERRRQQIRTDRLGLSTPPQRPPTGVDAPATSERAVTEALHLGRLDGHLMWLCSDCRHPLSSSEENWRDGAAVIEANPHQLDPVMYDDPTTVFEPTVDFVFRQWICPSCGQLLSVDAAQRGDEPPLEFVVIDPLSH